MEKQQYIEAGRVTNTHGVAGEVKIAARRKSSSPAKCRRAF